MKYAGFARVLASPFYRFIFAGGVAAVANIMARIALSQIMSYGLAVIVAYLIGMSTAYMLMRIFVFERSGNSMSQEYARFSLVNVFGLIQVWIVSEGLFQWFFPMIGFDWHAETVAHTIAVLSPIAASYFGHRFFTFAKPAGRPQSTI